MAGFCNIVISGNLTRKPELRKTPGGLDVTDLNVAVSAYKKGAPDNQQTTFYRASLFGARAENAVKFLDKGSSVIVSGRDLDVRTYQKNDGSTGVSPEFVADNWTFAGRKGDNGAAGVDESAGFTKGAAKDVAPTDLDDTINLDDVPF